MVFTTRESSPPGTSLDQQGTFLDQQGTFLDQQGTFLDQQGTFLDQQGPAGSPPRPLPGAYDLLLARLAAGWLEW